MEFIIHFLVLIVPGLIAAVIYRFISRCTCNVVVTGLIFDLLILIIIIIPLRYIKGILTMTELYTYFSCLSFLWKYAVLSISVGISLAIPYGFIARFFCKKNHA